ncbi:MAG: PilZ domain-containing protein [Candidatus Omnitrophica bacterium]|nr:PilZ domain-containing protein [Candidatus Omnitrophota bacterium]MDD5238405.1 PilZ domain-containing protein [Candidatus Omnitrophota bacterium]
MFKERRKFPRAEIKYRINIICEGSVILGEPKDFIFHTYTENISEGGIKVVLEKELKTASLVKLELYITTKKSLPIKCKGIVVWSKKTNPEGTKPDLFITGFQFLELEKRDQDVIGSIVNRCLGEKLKNK